MSNLSSLNATSKILDELGLDPRLLNRLDSVEDPARLLTRSFRAEGWTVDRTPDSNELRLTSPSGTTELRQVQGKVWRHPVATEKVCKDKELTRRLLEFEDVPVPRGMAFEAEDRDIADAVRPRLGHSVVVKPSNAGGSHGVTVGVTNRGVFREAWDRAASVRTPGRKIVVEEQLPGIEVRCYVVGEQVVSAILRIQPYVVGDGESTISQLIEKTIEYRSRNAWYDRARPTPDLSFLKSQDIELDEVPEKGKIIILNPFHLFRLGNYTVEVLEDLSPLIKDSAVRAVASIPNLEIAAVDFLTEDFRNSHGKVIEMNTAPALTQHLYPAFGEPKDVIGSIVEHFVRQSR